MIHSALYLKSYHGEEFILAKNASTWCLGFLVEEVVGSRQGWTRLECGTTNSLSTQETILSRVKRLRAFNDVAQRTLCERDALPQHRIGSQLSARNLPAPSNRRRGRLTGLAAR